LHPSKGGKDEYKNLQLLHRHCHDTKTAYNSSAGTKAVASPHNKERLSRFSKNFQ
jgi:5-methylcytosine-specific restriction endonuclease McrA